jgi:hypothetical protein
MYFLHALLEEHDKMGRYWVWKIERFAEKVIIIVLLAIYIMILNFFP